MMWNRLTPRQFFLGVHLCKNCAYSRAIIKGLRWLSSSSVDENEVKNFQALSSYWWDTNGTYKALHNMNELRISLIRDRLQLVSPTTDQPSPRSSHPLSGFSILDVGCGGGLISEPLARLGATVTGIDIVAENIAVAKHHANLDPNTAKRINYLCQPVESLDAETSQFDAVVASEVVEHVLDQPTFVANCCKLLKDGGSVFFTTLNKTWASRALAVFAAEKVLKIVPEGIHEWEKFLSPEDLTQILQQNNCTVKLVHGMLLNPLTLRWSWIQDTSINYALHAVKERQA